MGVNEHELASWGRRLAALLVDFTVLILVIATALLAAGVQAEELRDRVHEGETLLVVVLFLIPEAIYYTALIGYTRAFSRWLSTATFRAFFTIPTVIDHLWPLRDPRNQALHDKFARSVVVRT